jgi:hypothetical protein
MNGRVRETCVFMIERSACDDSEVDGVMVTTDKVIEASLLVVRYLYHVVCLKRCYT